MILLFLLYFWSNKCSLGKHKRLLSKTFKYLTNPTLLSGSVYAYFYKSEMGYI